MWTEKFQLPRLAAWEHQEDLLSCLPSNHPKTAPARHDDEAAENHHLPAPLQSELKQELTLEEEIPEWSARDLDFARMALTERTTQREERLEAMPEEA